MFSLGFSEMLILGIIVLVFIGPNELPEMARMLGRLLNEFRRSTDAIKDEWAKSTEDIRPSKLIGELRESFHKDIGKDLTDIKDDLKKSVQNLDPMSRAEGEHHRSVDGKVANSSGGHPTENLVASNSSSHSSVEKEIASSAESSSTGPSYPPDNKYTK